MFKRRRRAAEAARRIDEETLEKALRVLEQWHEENPDKVIQGVVYRDGAARFVVQDRKADRITN